MKQCKMLQEHRTQIYNVLIYHVDKKVEKEIEKITERILRLLKDFKKIDNSFLVRELKKEFDNFKKRI